jgi:DNA-binding SARP family transcriptional activator
MSDKRVESMQIDLDELISLRQQLAECEAKWNDAADCCAKGTALLAESQAREKVLRDALTAIIDQAQESTDQYHESMKGYRQARHDRMDADIQLARDALALPSDSTALDTMLAQVMRIGAKEALFGAAEFLDDKDLRLNTAGGCWTVAAKELRRMAKELE